MNRIFSPKIWLAALFACTALVRVNAIIIYNNTTNDLITRFNPGTLEVGDEIVLLPGADRMLTNFTFEFWGTASPGPDFAGSVAADVRIYLNDGEPFNGYPTPGTVLYHSGFFPLPGPTPRSTATFTAGSDFPTSGLFLGIPGAPLITNCTWSVQFSGLGPGDAAGVDVYSPPTVGTNHTDYWENDGGFWELKTNSVVMNFAALMGAQPSPVPVLNITAQPPNVILSWSTSSVGFVLQSTTSLDPTAWTNVSPGPSTIGGSFIVVTPISGTQQFFRLIQ